MSAFVSRRHSKQRPDSLSGERGVRSAFSVATTFQRVIWSPLPPHLNGTEPKPGGWCLRKFCRKGFPSNGFSSDHWALIRSWLPLFPVGESVQRYLTGGEHRRKLFSLGNKKLRLVSNRSESTRVTGVFEVRPVLEGSGRDADPCQRQLLGPFVLAKNDCLQRTGGEHRRQPVLSILSHASTALCRSILLRV